MTHLPFHFSDPCFAADIVFVLDASDNVPSEKEWTLVKNFTTVIISALAGDSNQYRFGAVVFGDISRVDVKFHYHEQSDGYINHVNISDRAEGVPLLDQAIKTARTALFEMDTRPPVPKFMIILTTEIDINAVPDIMLQADLAKREHIQIVAVGLTAAVDETILKNLTATQEAQDGYYYKSPSFNVLNVLYPDLISTICTEHTPTVVTIGKYYSGMLLYCMVC